MTGEVLQSKVNLALPLEIIDIRFAQNPCVFTEDKLFLVATYKAGWHWENRNLLAKEKAAMEQGSGTGSHKVPGKGHKEEDKGKGKEKDQQPGQTEKTEKGKIWKGLREAFQGVPQDEINKYKKTAQVCWRYGWDNHSTYQCYARTTKKGTILPQMPGQISAMTTTKRKHDKTGQAVVAAAGEDDRSEVPLAWTQD